MEVPIFLRVSCLVGLAVLWVEAALAQDAMARIVQQDEARHTACLSRAETDPEGAYEDALDWLSKGGRPLARHCAALALLSLGQTQEAAARLEALANAPDAGTIGKRALYLAQAGNAWMLARRPEAAEVALSSGLRLVPDDPGLLKDRARARLLLRKWSDGEADLGIVLQKNPKDTDALLLRARARFERQALQAAWSDIKRARKLAPERIDILVMRGKIRDAIRRKTTP